MADKTTPPTTAPDPRQGSQDSFEALRAGLTASAPAPTVGATDLLGVPAGYSPSGDMVGGFAQYGVTSPLYHQDDEIVLFGGLSPETLYPYQRELENLGLLRRGGYMAGVADDATLAGFRDVLAITNRRNTTNTDKATAWRDTLDWLVGEAKRRGSYGNGRTTRVELTNPQDLTAMVNEVAAKRMGRSLTRTESDRIVSSYQQAEAAWQQNADATGIVTKPPSLESMTGDQIARDPNLKVEVDTQAMVDTFNVFTKLLEGPVP